MIASWICLLCDPEADVRGVGLEWLIWVVDSTGRRNTLP
jgi:hypothetical protein